MSKEKSTKAQLSEMILEGKEDTRQNETIFKTDETRSTLEEELLHHVAKSKAIFKSQQKGDPELTFEEKFNIARSILEKSHCLFLSKFGHFLKKDHLSYFDQTKDEDYEVSYHINRLQRYFNDSARHTDVKNRRYEALKTLVEKGEYFSEREMMRRNPLLYEHLVGQYMTERQKKERDNIDTKNITFVNLLLEGIERDGIKAKQKLQEEEEDNVMEETDSDDEEEDRVSASRESNSSRENEIQWGENIDSENSNKNDNARQTNKVLQTITKAEIQILRQEFVSNMYQSFLDGKDVDFDYSTVDDNETYDNIELRTQDEEEKYFDSESPEIVEPLEKQDQSESEDELDAYMKSLKGENPTNTKTLDKQT